MSPMDTDEPVRFVKVTPEGYGELIEIVADAFKDEFTGATREQYVRSLTEGGDSSIWFIVYRGVRVGTFEIKTGNALASFNLTEGPGLFTFGIRTVYQLQGIGTKTLDKLVEQFGVLHVYGPSEASMSLYAKYPNILTHI